MNLLSFIAGALAVIIFRGLREKFFSRPADGDDQLSLVRLETDQQATSTPTPPLDIEKVFGPLDCDGTCCTPYETCNPVERLFCQKVLKPEAGDGTFWGQYNVVLPSGNARIDFAVGSRDGRRIAVELDGYGTHAKLSKKDFNKQLSRQNDLTNAGWQVLRFSVPRLLHQLKENKPLACRDVLRTALAPHAPAPLPPAPLVHADSPKIGVHDAERAKKDGLVFSEKAHTWYVAHIGEVAPNVPDAWQMRIWTACLRQGCKGRLEPRRRRDDGRFFWACDACSTTYCDRSGGSRREGTCQDNATAEPAGVIHVKECGDTRFL